MSKFTDGFDQIAASDELKEKTLQKIRAAGGSPGTATPTGESHCILHFSKTERHLACVYCKYGPVSPSKFKAFS